LYVYRVIANISASIVKPREDRPYEGLIYITSEMSGMTSQSYVEGRYVHRDRLFPSD
jgi:exosome complex component RRP45